MTIQDALNHGFNKVRIDVHSSSNFNTTIGKIVAIKENGICVDFNGPYNLWFYPIIEGMKKDKRKKYMDQLTIINYG